MYNDKPFHIGTVRFTNKTYEENLKWKERKKIKKEIKKEKRKKERSKSNK